MDERQKQHISKENSANGAGIRKGDNNSNMKQIEWISVNDRLPEFGAPVLVYYEIKASPKEDAIKCYEVGWLQSITHSKGSKSTMWIDKLYDGIEPLFWAELTEPNK